MDAGISHGGPRIWHYSWGNAWRKRAVSAGPDPRRLVTPAPSRGSVFPLASWEVCVRVSGPTEGGLLEGAVKGLGPFQLDTRRLWQPFSPCPSRLSPPVTSSLFLPTAPPVILSQLCWRLRARPEENVLFGSCGAGDAWATPCRAGDAPPAALSPGTQKPFIFFWTGATPGCAQDLCVALHSGSVLALWDCAGCGRSGPGQTHARQVPSLPATPFMSAWTSRQSPDGQVFSTP